MVARILFIFVVFASALCFGSYVLGPTAPDTTGLLSDDLDSGTFLVGNSSNKAAQYPFSNLRLDFSVPGDELLTIGKASTGGLPSLPLNIATWGHKDYYASFSFAFVQDGAGNSYLNTASGGTISLLTAFNTANPHLAINGTTGTFGTGLETRLKGSTSGYVGTKAPAAPTSYTITYPTATAANDDVMKFNSSSTASFGKIVNANIDGAAAIATTKLATFSANRIATTNGSGNLAVNATLTANKVVVASGAGALISPNLLHWDNTNSRLGIGTTSPTSDLHIRASVSPAMRIDSTVGRLFQGGNGSTDTITMTNDGTIDVMRFYTHPAGGGANQVKMGGTFATNLTDNGNVGTGEDTLHSFTLLANSMDANANRVESMAAFTFAANANNKRVRCKFGGSTFYDSGIQAQNGGSLELRWTIIRTGASAQKVSARAIASAGSLFSNDHQYSTLAIATSGAATILCTGEATSNDDIVQRISTHNWFNAP